jgi:hypothetical protein
MPSKYQEPRWVERRKRRRILRDIRRLDILTAAFFVIAVPVTLYVCWEIFHVVVIGR